MVSGHNTCGWCSNAWFVDNYRIGRTTIDLQARVTLPPGIGIDRLINVTGGRGFMHVAAFGGYFITSILYIIITSYCLIESLWSSMS